MAQYKIYNEGKYNYWTDPSTGLRYRVGQRNYNFVEDAEIQLGGFALAENVGWENVTGCLETIIAGGKCREGVRSGYYIVDGELTTLGVWEEMTGAY